VANFCETVFQLSASYNNKKLAKTAILSGTLIIFCSMKSRVVVVAIVVFRFCCFSKHDSLMFFTHTHTENTSRHALRAAYKLYSRKLLFLYYFIRSHDSV